MKKTLLILLLAIISLSACNHKNSNNNIVEEKSPHLTFRDIPIDKNAKIFAKQLEKIGYDIDETYLDTTNSYMLKGSVAGYNNCLLYLNCTHKDTLMYGLQIIFPQRDNWKELYKDYSNLKEQITQRHGEPTRCIEDFNTEIAPKNDDEKFAIFKTNQSTFGAIYETDYGYINLYIEPWNKVLGLQYCHATIYYIDKLNYDTFVSESKNIM